MYGNSDFVVGRRDIKLNVLLGLATNTNEKTIELIKNVIKNALVNRVVNISVANSLEEFEKLKGKRNTELVVSIETLGLSTEYSKLYKENEATWIVVVPEEFYASVEMEALLSSGIFNVVFLKDFNPPFVRKLVNNPRTYSKAKLYYGLNTNTRTEIIKSEEEKTQVKETKPKTRDYNGIKITRICGCDVKKHLSGMDDEDDEVLQSFMVSKNQSSEDEAIDEESGRMPVMTFKLDPEWTKEYLENLKSFFRTAPGIKLLQEFRMMEISESDFRERIESRLKRYGLTEIEAVKTVTDIFIKSIVSYSVLDRVINTDGVSDIRLLNKDTVNVQYKGHWYRTNISFNAESEYEDFIKNACMRNKQSVHVSNAMSYFTDRFTCKKAILRFMITHGMLNAYSNATAHIRKVDKTKKSEESLISEGYITDVQLKFLRAVVNKQKSIIICGPSGSGKTILLNRILEWLPEGICGEVIQESDELFSEKLKNIEFNHSKQIANSDSAIEYDLESISRSGLVKNAELFVIGEIKGAEARQFVSAANEGAQVFTTTHADSVFDAVGRIADLSKIAGDYSYEELLKMIAQHINYVVFLKDYGVRQIAKIIGYDGDKKDVIYDLYEF
ncbi:MAG: Flp pilus assembly complex ATPase component TadA [Lachnospiraceae bacterium]|nr:Flp pilus assembly complex ATPase component TadA [Lachnospiraceae bacterium]